MFLTAVLVLFMQAGFAMLEVGLNASKNTVNILFKNVMDLSIGIMLFLFLGYGNHVQHGRQPVLWVFRGVCRSRRSDEGRTGQLVYLIKQYHRTVQRRIIRNRLIFCSRLPLPQTAATIVSGAVAGRMKFGAYLIYSGVLTGLIYPISGFWKWGGGFLHQEGFQDFAGSVVVHAVGGFAGLAGAIALGPRLGRYVQGKSVPIPGHNIAFAALGVFILWVGWYGFNPGSQLTYYGHVTRRSYQLHCFDDYDFCRVWCDCRDDVRLDFIRQARRNHGA